MLKREDEALEEFKLAVNMNSANFVALEEMAEIFNDRREFQSGLNHAEKALLVNPESEKALSERDRAVKGLEDLISNVP